MWVLFLVGGVRRQVHLDFSPWYSVESGPLHPDSVWGQYSPLPLTNHDNPPYVFHYCSCHLRSPSWLVACLKRCCHVHQLTPRCITRQVLPNAWSPPSWLLRLWQHLADALADALDGASAHHDGLPNADSNRHETNAWVARFVATATSTRKIWTRSRFKKLPEPSSRQDTIVFHVAAGVIEWKNEWSAMQLRDMRHVHVKSHR